MKSSWQSHFVTDTKQGATQDSTAVESSEEAVDTARFPAAAQLEKLNITSVVNVVILYVHTPQYTVHKLRVAVDN